VEVATGSRTIGGLAVAPGAVERVEDADQGRDLGALPAAVLLEDRLGGPMLVRETQSSDHLNISRNSPIPRLSWGFSPVGLGY
jgi:hypothetical protein